MPPTPTATLEELFEVPSGFGVSSYPVPHIDGLTKMFALKEAKTFLQKTVDSIFANSFMDEGEVSGGR
eukprot:4041434-Pyramimonas_sp.AAC.1